MDRCLSKVLVEHARKGNKSDSIIKPATYAAAVAVLNENFGLDLTKDHIKNRLKTGRKQYGLLKEILAQKGFKWNRARKMVVADDAVWSDYIKINPDAKHFHAKFFENYDELCIIVGNDQAIASWSDNGAEIDVDFMSDNEGVESTIVPEIRSDDKQAKNLRWTEEMDCCLGKILVEQMQKGYKIDNLQCEAYGIALTALKDKFRPDLSKDHIRNRLKTWRKQYGVLKELLFHTGFTWNAAQKVVVGSDSVWSDYIKTHPNARLYRGRIVENLDNLQTIFGNVSAFEFSPRNSDALLGSTPGYKDVEATDTFQIQSSCTKEQTRHLIWTKEMDCCLGNILVKQYKEGNKLDSNLKSRVCTDAVTAINKKFHLDLTKDHIRTRLKTWKKQYGILKELLDQEGFTWDETRKMVVADDSAWDDYIKTYRDARPFRGRVNPDVQFLRGQIIENYAELCIIIGNDNPIECSVNDAEANLDWAADKEGVDTEVYQNRSDNGKDKGKYVIWSDEMDCCLTKKLIEQMKMGNKLEKNFKPLAFKAVVKALNENFGLDLTKENIRSRLKTWKKLYRLVNELLCHRGFEWDDGRKMVVANDSVWNEYIKMHPDAKCLQARSIENYDELRVIIGNDHATGAKCDVNPASNNEEHMEIPLRNMMINEEMSQDHSGDGTQWSSKQTRARSSSSSRSKQPSKFQTALKEETGKCCDCGNDELHGCKYW